MYTYKATLLILWRTFIISTKMNICEQRKKKKKRKCFDNKFIIKQIHEQSDILYASREFGAAHAYAFCCIVIGQMFPLVYLFWNNK